MQASLVCRESTGVVAMTSLGVLPVEATVQSALEYFKEHGWAEAVLLAVSEAADRECDPHIAAGFQGGMMAGEVCGAAVGAALVIGLLYGEDAELAAHLTEEFMRRFGERNEKVRCMDIIGFNIGSASTSLEISSKKDFFLFLARGGKRGCKKVVRNAVEVLVEQVNEWESWMEADRSGIKLMRAMVCTRYGPPESLELRQVPIPEPREDEVLVRNVASAVTTGDWRLVTGRPFFLRLMTGGLFRPKNKILGADIAGQVEAVGAGVDQFQPGDEVYGDIGAYGFGGYAEYVAVPQQAVAPKPEGISFEAAAASAQSGGVALQGLTDVGEIQAGQKVLIVGASGGIGSFAVQIAKAYGAEVTGVCGTRNLEFVRSIGADHVIDYTRDDFAQVGQQYDLILATAGYRSVKDYKSALSPKGKYVMAGGTMRQIFEAAILGPSNSERGGRTLTNLDHKPSQEELTTLKGLIESGKVNPVIDRTFPLEELPQAINYYGQGHATGVVAISIRQ